MSRTKDQVRSRYARYLNKPPGSFNPTTPTKNSPNLMQNLPIITEPLQQFQFHSQFIPHVGTPQSPSGINPPNEFDIQVRVII
jgi:hypothetical protein